MRRFLLLICSFFLPTIIFGTTIKIFVSPNGNDSNPGSRQAPLATLNAAVVMANHLRLNKESNIIEILLEEGVFEILETIDLVPTINSDKT